MDGHFTLFVLALLGAIASAVAVSALLALPVMWLWNGVVPALFAAGAIQQIGFWNAWGLSLLCGLLFGTHVSKD